MLYGNYRTCRAIVEFNNGFFPFAAGQLDAQLTGQLGGNKAVDDISRIYQDVKQNVCFKDPAEGSVDIRFVEGYDAEMDEIVASVRSVIDAGGKYGDVAILVRGNQEGAAIAARLVAEGMPVVSDDSLFVKSSVTVRRLVSQLSLVDAPDSEDHASVGGFLARSMAIRIPDHYHSLTDLAESLLRDLRDAAPATFEAEVPYIQSFMDYLLDWSASRGNDLAAFLREWADVNPKIASPETGSSVRVMTVHKSKGLEFPYVIFPFAEKVTLYKGSSYWCRPAVDRTPLEDFANGVYHVELSKNSEETLFADDYHEKPWNLLLDRTEESLLTQEVTTVDPERTNQYANRYNNPRPAPNPIMYQLGDAMDALVEDPSTGEWIPSNNEKYILHDSNDELQVVDSEDIDFE